MTNEEIEDKIQSLKQEAIKNLDSMFGTPEGFSSGTANRIVDCIVSAAILEIVSTQTTSPTLFMNI